MNSVPKGLLISAGAAILLLLAINLWLAPDQALQHSPTSFGVMRDGYKAAFDLLSEMHYPVARSFQRPDLTPPNQTVWFVAPSFLDPEKSSAYADADQVVQWARAGGTAVVFGDPASNWKALGLTHDVAKAPNKDDRSEDRVLIQGEVSPKPRWIESADVAHFSASSDQHPQPHADERVVLTAGGKPFALELPLGEHHGRIIAVADGNFLRNQHLGDADASVLVADLAHAYGSPVFDEHAHGLAPPASLTLAVLDSRALLPLLIGALASMLWIFSQRSWPGRSLADDSGLPAPSIASFVESLAILYSRAEDPATVFRAYRAGFLRRQRRQAGLRADYPEDQLLERIARDRSLPAETRHWLLENDAPTDQRHLVIAVRAIESYGHEDRA